MTFLADENFDGRVIRGLLARAPTVVMEREGITDALTGDHHFEQAGFRALLK